MSHITQIKQGDEKAFKFVYDTFHTKLFRFFLKRAQTVDAATELTQAVFVKLWQFRSSLKEDLPFEKQLIIMANSVLIDYLRRQAQQHKIQSSVTAQVAADATLQTTYPSGEFEQNNYLRVAMEQLPPMRKKVLHLKIQHGLSNKEIAGLLSIGIKTVEDHITKAVRQVKLYIK